MKIFQANIPLLLIIVVLGLFSSTAILKPSWEIGGDGFGYYSYIRSAIFDLDLNFENEFRFFDEQYGHETLTYWRTPTGKAGNPFAIGSAILWSPFIGAAYAVDQQFDLGKPFVLQGYTLPYQIAVGAGTWFYAIFGITLIFAALRRLFPSWISFFAVLSTFAVSPLPFYFIYEPSMAHGLTVFTTGLVFYVAIRIYDFVRASRRKIGVPLRWFLFTGTAIGLAFLVRWQDVLYGIIPLGILIYKFSQSRRDRGVVKKIFFTTFLLISSFFVIISFQLAVWKHLYGSLIAVPQGSGFFNFTNPRLFDFLFSGYHGMFTIHPVLLIGITGLVAFFCIPGQSSNNIKNRLLALLLLFTLVLQIYLNASLIDWQAGSSFGARRMVSSFFIFAFGFAALFYALYRKYVLIGIISFIIVLGFVFNGLLMVSYARGILQINEPTSIIEVYSTPFRLLM